MSMNSKVKQIRHAAESSGAADNKDNLIAFTLGFSSVSRAADSPSITTGIARLTYWSGHGNAELVRLMMEVCGQPYEERVYGSAAKTLSQPTEMYRMIKDGVLAFDQVPLLEIDGLCLVQKFAIMRYLARKHDMYGANATEAVLCDMAQEGLCDFTSSKNKAKYLPRFERMLTSTPGNFLVSSEMQFVDVLFFYMAGILLKSADLDAYPALKSYHQRLVTHPRLAAYMASGRRYPSPGAEGYYSRVFWTLPWLLWDGDSPSKMQGLGLVKHWSAEKLAATKCAPPTIGSKVWHYQATRGE